MGQRGCSAQELLQWEKRGPILRNHRDNCDEIWSTAVNTFKAAVVVVPAHQGRQFRCEFFAERVPRGEGTGTLYPHLRWLVAFCGGHQNKNFVGCSADSWEYKLGSYASTAAAGEYSASFFVVGMLLLHWSSRKLHKNSQWKLGAEHVQATATMLLRALCRAFVTASQAVCIRSAKVQIVLTEDNIHMKWHTFCSSSDSSLKCLKDMFPEEHDFCECLQMCCREEVSPNISAANRESLRKAVALLLQAFADLVEGSRMSDIWQETELWTKKGYKRLSGSQKAAVLEQTKKQHLRSASSVLASQEGAEGKQRCNLTIPLERYAYAQEARARFGEAHWLSLAIDGVQVGSKSLLNVLAWDGDSGWSCICPPQAEVPWAALAHQLASEAQARVVEGSNTENSPNQQIQVQQKLKAKAGEEQADWDRLKGKGVEDVPRPRQASLAWMQDVKHALKFLGQDLFSFKVELPYSSDIPKSLILTTDQEATQLAACNFLKDEEQGINLELIFDPQHRRGNDAMLGFASSGTLRRAIFAIGLYNLQYGRISKDLDEPASNNTEQRRAATSRFNSLQHAQDHLDPYWATFAFLLTVVCLTQGYVQFADELWTPDDVLKELLKPEQSGAAAAGSSTDVGPTGGTTKQAGIRQAKEQMNKMRSKTVNTLHVYAKWINDPVNKSYARLMFYLQQPEAVDSGQMLVHMRSEESTREFFMNCACWSFLNVAKDQLLVLSDLRLLKRIGFDMQRDSARTLSEDFLALQDELAEIMFLVLRKLLKYRLGSMLQHTWSLPHKLAALLERNEEKQAAARSFLKTVASTLQAVQAKGTLAAKQMLKGQHSPIGNWALDRLAKVEFQTTPAEVFHMEVSEMLSWRIGTQHDLLKGYKRKEIQAADVRSPPKDYDPQLLFRRQVDRMSKPERTEREEKIESTLKKICGPTKWYVCTPESHQQTMVNLALLVHIKEEFERVESAWHGSPSPEGHVVFVKETNNYKFVLRTYRNGALVWPMTTKIPTERGEGCRAWTFDLEVSELEFLFVFDKTGVLVHPLKMMSPVRMWLAHKSSGSGVTLTSHKAACSLESFHTSTGFANLSEEILKRLCKDWAVPLPKSQKALAETKALRTALLLNKNPGLEAASVKAAVMKGDGNLEGEDEFDLEEEAKRKPAEKASSAAAPSRSGTGGGTRTYDPVPAEIDRLLHASIPMGGKVYTDEDNGRWKIGFSTDEVHQQRSLSWTTAGGPAAGLAAVRQLWSWSELYSGEGMSEQAAKNEEAMIAAREPGPQKTFLFLK
ncbi:unnamed protein product [Symbiodinium sp. CCMP2592]|nr:unnamed protein product [Symbiodinium sp. CCMP2592]